MQKCLQIIIYGKVQNVGFRHFIKEKAISLSLTGFVQNLSDKTVYVETQGDKTCLEKFVKFCRLGPSHAQVSKLAIKTCPVKNYLNFKIRI